jgi:hypothetical protein
MGEKGRFIMKRLSAGAPLIAVSLTLLVTSPVDAQMGRGRPGGAPARPNVITPAPPTRPQVMLPVPRQPSTVAPTSPFNARSYTYAPRYAPRYDGRSRPLRPYAYPYGYGYRYGYYGYGSAPIYSPDDVNVGALPYPEAAPVPAEIESVGRVFIDTEPATAQVFVDGIPVGIVADFRGVGMLLPEGLRHVELRAPNYESATFDINILSSQPAVHRGDLTAVRPATGPAAAPVRRGSDTFYVIPGCYIGNVPPREVSLTQGCDLSKARTIK